MDKGKKVSIIIPIYNSEEYLEECLKSLVKQTYKEIECILINDGSKDNSREICEKYTKKFSYMKLYNMENSGTSIAKNRGISLSKGEYILFIDSDDYVDENYVEDLMKYNSFDIVIQGYYVDYIKMGYSIDTKIEKEKKYTDNEISQCIKNLDTNGLLNVCVSKLYRANLIKENNIEFNGFLTTGEDLTFNCDYFKYIKTAYIDNNSSYHYIRRDVGSLVSKYKKDLIAMIKVCNEKRKELYKHYKMEEDEFKTVYDKTYIEYFSATIPNLYRVDCELTKEEKINNISIMISDEYLNECIKVKNNKFNKLDLLFIKLVKINNKYLIYYLYLLLFNVRNKFSSIYFHFRKYLLR